MCFVVWLLSITLCPIGGTYGESIVMDIKFGMCMSESYSTFLVESLR